MRRFRLASCRPLGYLDQLPPGSAPADGAPIPDQDLWAREGMALAAPEAFPIPMGLTEAGRVVRPTPEQLTLMEALLRGFAGLDAAQAAGDALEFKVGTFDGPATLRLRCGARL